MRRSRPPALPVPSLAILPLVNRTGDAKQGDFVDGMTDELILALARMGGPRVTSRVSAMQYKNTQKPRLPDRA